MRFLNGSSYANKFDYTMMMPSMLFAEKGEVPLGGAPWITYSEEEAQVDAIGRRYYWDLEEAKFHFLTDESENKNQERQPLISQS